MNDEVLVDPRRLAAVVYDVGVAVDDLLLVFAQDLAAHGVRVGGLLQVPRGGPGCGPKSPMQLHDIATGEVFPICQDLGRHAEDCSIDPAMLRHAAVRIRAATESSTDLVIVSRFGKEEARGQGFRDELASAALRGRPVLTAVRRGMIDNWLSFTDGIGTLLDAHLWVLKDWWNEIEGRSVSSAEGNHRDALAGTHAHDRAGPGDAVTPDPSQSCRSGPTTGPIQISDSVRWVQAVQEFELPAVPFPSRRIYHGAGESCLRELVRKHHDNLRRSSIGSMFPEADAMFDALATKVADYVVEACGGPARFTPIHGNTCMRTRHFPFTIDEKAREVWLMCLWQAFDEAHFPEALRREYWDWMEPFSARMINRRTTKVQPPRFPFDVMLARFRPL